MERYTNVDYELQRDYFENGAKNIKSELPYNAQEFYAVIDKVIQKVLNDPDADPYTELLAAEESFTDIYLNFSNEQSFIIKWQTVVRQKSVAIV